MIVEHKHTAKLVIKSDEPPMKGVDLLAALADFLKPYGAESSVSVQIVPNGDVEFSWTWSGDRSEPAE